MTRRLRSIASLLLLLLASFALATTGCGPSAQRRAEAVAAFGTVQQVLQHPRCANCHIAGDVPRQFDASIPHSQAVVRGPSGVGVPGMPCSTCHADANPPASYGPHAPPGAPGWRLPPPGRELVFLDATPAQLCETLTDPKLNGGHDLATLVHFVENDELVAWGWAPGEGRSPVPIARDEFVAQFKSWANAGGPCPDGG